MASYDAWLEAPFQRDAEESDAFAVWAEEMGWDLDDFLQAFQAQRAYEAHLQDQYESKLEAEYEAAMERKYEEAQEREWDY